MGTTTKCTFINCSMREVEEGKILWHLWIVKTKYASTPLSFNGAIFWLRARHDVTRLSSRCCISSTPNPYTPYTPPHPQSLSFHSPLRYLESSSSLILWIVKQGVLNLERNLVGTNKWKENGHAVMQLNTYHKEIVESRIPYSENSRQFTERIVYLFDSCKQETVFQYLQKLACSCFKYGIITGF